MEKLGVSFGGGLTPAEVVECANLADDLGYDSVWMSEGNGGDQFSVLTACALATQSVRLGTSISSVYVRSAPTIAMAAACVDHFSKGRFILGLGSSHRVQVEGQHGLAYSKPLARQLEAVEIIRRLLKDGSVTYQGNIFNIEQFDLAFTPFKPEIPIYLAAVFPKMLKLCGEVAQGVILTQNTPRKATEAAKMVAEGASKKGRDPSSIEVASLIACYVTSEPASARDEVRRSLAHTCGFYPRYNRFIAESGFAEETAVIRKAWLEGDRQRAVGLVTDGMVDAFAIIGDAEECRRRIEEHRRAGVTLPILTFRTGATRPKEQMMETIRACAPR